MSDIDDTLRNAMRELDERMTHQYTTTHKTVASKLGGKLVSSTALYIGITLVAGATAYFAFFTPAASQRAGEHRNDTNPVQNSYTIQSQPVPSVVESPEMTSLHGSKADSHADSRIDVKIEQSNEARLRVKQTNSKGQELVAAHRYQEAVRCYLDGAEWCWLLNKHDDAITMVNKALLYARQAGDTHLIDESQALLNDLEERLSTMKQ